MNATMDGEEFEATVEGFGESRVSSGELKLAIRARAEALEGEQRAHFEAAGKPFLEESGGWRELRLLARISRGGMAGEPLVKPRSETA